MPAIRGSAGKVASSAVLWLQVSVDRRMLSGEAFAVPLAVVLEVAVALLGEAEALAVVVACEELPHHYGRPARLPLNTTVRTPSPPPINPHLSALASMPAAVALVFSGPVCFTWRQCSCLHDGMLFLFTVLATVCLLPLKRQAL